MSFQACETESLDTEGTPDTVGNETVSETGGRLTDRDTLLEDHTNDPGLAPYGPKQRERGTHKNWILCK